MKYKIYSWNVNGIRATVRNGHFLPWLKKSDGDIICLQETKAQEDQLDKTLVKPRGYSSFWHAAQKKGYSGVGTFVRTRGKKAKSLNSTEISIGVAEFDDEGRVLISKFDEFTVLNVYFPNGKKNDERLQYKMRFYEHFLQFCQELRKKGEKIVICGDVNTAHNEIDLANPKPNSKYSGFLLQERAWMDKLVEKGYIDTYRHLNPDKKGAYTWWTGRLKSAKENNVGWRLDYFFISEDLLENLKNATIYRDVEGSDHCPVSIDLEF
ncbi:MAG: exodeoxyribonuclease III [Candidatus Kariarchaeaceae archaeon]|jgi:exodeoxyribonuclease-3